MTTPLTNPYFKAVTLLLQKIEETQADRLEQAARQIAQSLEKGGVIHTFGCGHSASVTADAFHRSGCFAAVNAILDPDAAAAQTAEHGSYELMMKDFEYEVTI